MDHEYKKFEEYALYILESLSERRAADVRLDEKMNEGFRDLQDQIHEMRQKLTELQVKVAVWSALGAGAVSVGIQIIHSLLK